jgi:hypothetical protein
VARIGGTSVRFSEESELADFSRTAQGIVVRQSVIDHLYDARVSGWRPGCVNVEIDPTLSNHDTNYSELIIIGRTKGYPERVRLSIDADCSECGRRTYAPPRDVFVIPEDTWDGSDIFAVEGIGEYVVTDEFRQVVEEHGHTGVDFVPIAEWRDPFEWMRY